MQSLQVAGSEGFFLLMAYVFIAGLLLLVAITYGWRKASKASLI